MMPNAPVLTLAKLQRHDGASINSKSEAAKRFAADFAQCFIKYRRLGWS